MTRRPTVTEATIRRVMKAAREIDPKAVVEVTHDGNIRILPHEPREPAKNEVDAWFEANE